MEEINFTIPYPTSVNRMYVASNQSRWSQSKEKWYRPRHLTYEAQKFKKHVAEIIFYSFPKVKYGDLPIEAHIIVHPPADRRTRDHHNGEKIVFDAIEESGIINNDKQIVKRSSEIAEKVDGGKWVINLKPYNSPKVSS